MRFSLRSIIAALVCVGLAGASLVISEPAAAASSTTSKSSSAKSAPKTASKTATKAPTKTASKAAPKTSVKKSVSHKSSRKRRPVRRPDPGFAARDAYYSGDVAKAYPLAVAAGEKWVAALSAYRLEDYPAAYDLFKQVVAETTSDDWLKAGAAFWASRTAVAAGVAEEENGWLQAAAANPWTFYGMVAEAKLGQRPVATFASVVLPPDVLAAEAGDPLARLIRASATNIEQVETAMAAGGDRGAIAYPTPVLMPDGGCIIDPALVYAIVRQESRFNATAGSRVGARGLMQLMPATAALTADDPRYRTNRSLLNNPGDNLRLGQTYVNLLANEMVGDDILKVVAGYNGGPQAVIRTLERMGQGSDPFLFIESLPAKETRDYVEKVVAGYWLYRRQFGQDTPSLAALVRGEQVSINYDRLTPKDAERPFSEPIHFTNSNSLLQPVSNTTETPTARRLF